RLRKFVRQRMEAGPGGKGWENHGKYMPAAVRDKAKARAKGGPALSGTTLGELFQVARCVPALEPDLRQVLDDVAGVRVTALRNDNEHADAPLPKAGRLRTARAALDRL